MSALYWIAPIVTLGLLGYIFYAATSSNPCSKRGSSDMTAKEVSKVS